MSKMNQIDEIPKEDLQLSLTDLPNEILLRIFAYLSSYTQWARNSFGLDKIEFWVLEIQNFFVFESLTRPQRIC